MTADTVGGVWQYALELADALVAHGVGVALATMGAPLSRTQRADAQRILNLQIYESSYRLEWMHDPWHDVIEAGAWLLGLEKRLQPAVVHLNSYAHAALDWRAPTLVVGHSCVYSWWAAVRGQEPPAEWAHYRDAVRRGLRAAHMVVAPTHAMLTALERHYGGFVRSAVIPNGRTRRRLTPGIKAPLIFSAGRLWDEAKNIAALDQVAPRLPWPVYVAGDIQHPDGGCAHHQHVRPLGNLNQSDLARWMSRAAIYALPARYEPFGLSIVEAALCGCALVLGDIPSLREVWDDAAIYVHPDDTHELEAVLRRLIDDVALRARLAQRARARARQYTPERMGSAYAALYQQLAMEVGMFAAYPHQPTYVQPLARSAGSDYVSRE